MIYNVTYGFEGRGQGWSESHAMLNAAENPSALEVTVRDIASKRAQMLGIEFTLNRIRISRYSTDAGVRMRGVFPISCDYKLISQAANQGAEPANVALLVRGFASPSIAFPQFDANTNQTFLGAPLDLSVDDGGIVYQARGGLGAAFAQWRSIMLSSNSGYLPDVTIAEIPVITIAQNINGTVTYTVDVADTGALVVGQVYEARVKQVNQGRSPLNIAQKLKLVTATTLVTRRVIGIPTAQSLGSIRVYKQVSPFIDFGDLVLMGKVAKHKRGRPFGSTPGRLPTRILG